MSNSKKIVFCQCKYARVIPKDTKEAVEENLKASGTSFTCVDDLCDMSVHKPEELRKIKGEDNLEVIACHQRAVKGIFHNANIDLDDKHTVHNMRETSAQTIIENVRNNIDTQDNQGQVKSYTVDNPEWKPWFPVLDYDRCTNCLQCMSFCLFGVYGVDEKEQIKVENPQNCKTDCPACSRVCPDVAIMFPKYKNAPMNGAPVDESALQKETVKVDISDLLGGDIYDTLRERRRIAKSRFSKERDESKAAKERKRCLKELQDKLKISDELINSLSDEEKKMIGLPLTDNAEAHRE